ncbi:hypothetical protein E2C01_005352 [Portunus trituberculatus]|uniref:Uncharacterized protein n=1 Tax=Portunus trituberculatus TaxID=210409 RepID=A0A5B7CU74_PORTR|nr:hypothetical protein [Portunus trituberculatus]
MTPPLVDSGAPPHHVTRDLHTLAPYPSLLPSRPSYLPLFFRLFLPNSRQQHLPLLPVPSLRPGHLFLQRIYLPTSPSLSSPSEATYPLDSLV